MTQFKDEWLEHQRQRFMRPDAYRWMPPVASKPQRATEALDAKSDTEFDDQRLVVALHEVAAVVGVHEREQRAVGVARELG